jgi:hypothetical protein
VVPVGLPVRGMEIHLENDAGQIVGPGEIGEIVVLLERTGINRGIISMLTGLLEAAVPLCRTPEERRFFQQFILDRIVVNYLIWCGNEPNSAGKIIDDCLERLRLEGNTHLLRKEELPPILQELKRRPDIKVPKRSRMRRFIYRMHQRSRMGEAIYPTSRMRRVIGRSTSMGERYLS